MHGLVLLVPLPGIVVFNNMFVQEKKKSGTEADKLKQAFLSTGFFLHERAPLPQTPWFSL